MKKTTIILCLTALVWMPLHSSSPEKTSDRAQVKRAWEDPEKNASQKEIDRLVARTKEELSKSMKAYIKKPRPNQNVKIAKEAFWKKIIERTKADQPCFKEKFIQAYQNLAINLPKTIAEANTLEAKTPDEFDNRVANIAYVEAQTAWKKIVDEIDPSDCRCVIM